MPQRVFVKVVGFSAVERHALSTLFRLSGEREAVYELWPGGAQAPHLLLLDGDTLEAQAELLDAPADTRLIWVGPEAPVRSWRVFDRPIAWPEVVRAMDEVFAAKAGIDFELHNTDDLDTQPPEPQEPGRRALVASPDREQRLYLRARLALAGLTGVDEAGTLEQALELARAQTYSVALVEHDPPALDGCALVRGLQAAGAAPYVIFLKAGVTLRDRLRAWWCGADACLGKPVDPATLQAVLVKAARGQLPVEPDLILQ